MNETDIFNALTKVDEDLIERAVNENTGNIKTAVKKRRGIRFITAACICLAALTVIILIPALTNGDTTQPAAPGEYLIGSGKTLEAGNNYVVKELPTYGSEKVMLRAEIDTRIIEIFTSISDKPENALCLEILGQWFSASYSKDLERILSLFPKEQADKKVEDAVRAEGLTREEFIEKLKFISKLFRVGDVEISYTITGCNDTTEEFREEYAEIFAEYGMDVSKVTKAVKYDTGIMAAVFFDKFDFCPSLPESEFYEYEGKWYLNPRFLFYIEQLAYQAADRADNFVTGSETVAGTVTQIGEGYFTLGGSVITNYIILTDNTDGVTLGGEVCLKVYKNAGLTVKEKDRRHGWIPVRTLISVIDSQSADPDALD